MAKSLKHEYKSTQNYDFDIRPGETDLEYYRRLAKTADQRLVRLEKLKSEPHFENVDKYAYARAMRDIEVWGGGRRFNTKPPEDRRQFNEKISDMLRFLQSPTSTKGGIKEVYQKRVDTLNKKYNLNMTWQQFADITESKELDAFMGGYASDTVFRAIGKVQRNRGEIQKALDKQKENGKGDEEELKEQLQESGVLTDSPLDKGVQYILNNPELLEMVLA